MPLAKRRQRGSLLSGLQVSACSAEIRPLIRRVLYEIPDGYHDFHRWNGRCRKIIAPYLRTSEVSTDYGLLNTMKKGSNEPIFYWQINSFTMDSTNTSWRTFGLLQLSNLWSLLQFGIFSYGFKIQRSLYLSRQRKPLLTPWAADEEDEEADQPLQSERQEFIYRLSA